PGGGSARAGDAHPGDRSRDGAGAHAPDRPRAGRVRPPLLRGGPARHVHLPAGHRLHRRRARRVRGPRRACRGSSRLRSAYTDLAKMLRRSTRGVRLKPHADITDTETVKALSHPLRVQILRMLEEKDGSSVEIATALGLPVNRVSYHMRQLARFDLIKLVKTTPWRGAGEHHHRLQARPRSSVTARRQVRVQY